MARKTGKRRFRVAGKSLHANVCEAIRSVSPRSCTGWRAAGGQGLTATAAGAQAEREAIAAWLRDEADRQEQRPQTSPSRVQREHLRDTAFMDRFRAKQTHEPGAPRSIALVDRLASFSDEEILAAAIERGLVARHPHQITLVVSPRQL